MTEKLMFNLFLIIAGFILLVYYVRYKKVEAKKEEEHVPLMTTQIHKDLEAMANSVPDSKQFSVWKIDELYSGGVETGEQVKVIDEDSESCLKKKKVRDPSSKLVEGEKFFIVFRGFRCVLDGFVEDGKLMYEFNHEVLEVLSILEEGTDYICLSANANFYTGDIFNIGECTVMFYGEEAKAENFIYVEHKVNAKLVCGKVYVHAVTQKLMYVNVEKHDIQAFSPFSAEEYSITRFISVSEIEPSGDVYEITDTLMIDVTINNTALKETDIEIGYSNLVQ